METIHGRAIADGAIVSQSPGSLSFAHAAWIWLAATVVANGLGWRLADESGGYGLGGLLSGLGALSAGLLGAAVLPQLCIIAAAGFQQRSWRSVRVGAAIFLVALPALYLVWILGLAAALEGELLILIIPVGALASALLSALTWQLLQAPAAQDAADLATAAPWRPWLRGGRRDAPRAVRVGVDSLWGAFALQILTVVIVAFASGQPVAVLVSSLGLVIPASTIVLIARRHGWARVLYLFFFVPAVATSITFPYSSVGYGWFLMLSAICQLTTQAVAFALLFCAPAAQRWYRSGFVDAAGNTSHRPTARVLMPPSGRPNK